MNGIPQQSPQKKQMRRLVLAPVFVLVVLLMLISGCAARSSATPSSSPSPSATSSQTPPPTASATSQPSAIPRHVPRTVYPTPRIEPVSPIPNPLSGLSIPDEVRLIVLMGSDNPAPFTSRTDAMMLAFYNPRLAKVALLSLPPEMFVYIPGYTMQRVNVAYAVGGFEMLADTIEYNLGIRPDEFAVVHKDDFTWFVEELDGLDVNTMRNYYYDCGGIPAGSIHLRGGKVARGGLRWSDRMEDFRTEVLGLMKAQMVKNAVIVPVGSKGGFVVKNPPPGGDRDAVLQEGIACYHLFLRGLLDLTDNLLGGQVVPPADLVRHDEDDPYLVVAADKGTAHLSDTANAISAEYGFWLGDAFASGGSHGYDHKELGI
ncbi:MAG: hypothetical protein CVU24_17855, partial [Betaproteobacteria bacterium HGW-Betaproteobacteria-18]